MAALKAWKAKDDNGVLATMRERRGKSESERRRLHSRGFVDGRWQMKAMSGWDGMIKEVKISSDGDSARVWFHDLSPTLMAIAELENKDGKWYFKELRNKSANKWATYGK